MPHVRTVPRSAKSLAVSDQSDICALILADHKPLKKLIQIMKSPSAGFEDRVTAFEQFTPLLVAHSKPEEQVLYALAKEINGLRSEGFEGEVEHALADQMIEDIRRTTDQDEFMARVKVLAELVGRHIKEEESELLPDFKKHSNKDVRREMGYEFLDAKADYEIISTMQH